MYGRDSSHPRVHGRDMHGCDMHGAICMDAICMDAINRVRTITIT